MRQLGWAPRGAMAALLVLFLQLPAASAADLNIAAFFGQWRGSAVSSSNVSIYFEITERDLDVRVGPYQQGGFEITWSTVQRQKGDPNNPTEILKSTTMAFLPTSKAGQWRAVGAGDPVETGNYAWAGIKKKTLTIYSMSIGERGTYEMQIYRRTLSGRGMALEFNRVNEGQPKRSAKGQLIKYGK